MAISELTGGYSPRLDGEDAEHVRILADTQQELPPIVVHRPTMRVIDGMHRLRAAAARGNTEIEVEFFDGTEQEAFIRAVRDNIKHGLPLSRADREAAVEQIVRSHPTWSNRSVAEATGVSPPTVGAIRKRTTGKTGQSNVRVGRDGRARPMSGAEGRLRAASVISEHPNASLRDVAHAAGVSISTAQDVRRRLRRGEGPLPDRFSPKDPLPTVDTAQLLATLRGDPSMRFTGTGRTLLQWLGVCEIWDDHGRILDTVPAHCVATVAILARRCAQSWTSVADELDRRGHAMQ
nr:StrR protein [Kibdelosporangium sp. MJ126-NF4]CTQ88221.1 StrR protein [Kibdelosporangium sp. MJ126-NF4]